MTRTIEHWIGGRIYIGSGQDRSPVLNPATGEETAQVALADPYLDVAAAVASARVAADAWAATSLSHRSGVLFAMRALIHDESEALARVITAEHGKTLADARGEVARGLENVEFACGLTSHLAGEHATGVATGVDVRSVREPLGVVVGITPFNFPVMVPLWMCANAIAAGNAFVLKPSEKTPSAAILLAELWQRAGLPAGVFTVLHGAAATATALVEHPGVAAVSFVGSTPVAREVHRNASEAGTRVQALGGAKNHMLVMPDSDVDAAADAAIAAGFGSAGERCMAVSVVVAVGDVADRLVDAIAVRIPKLVVGAGDAAGTDMGPLITAAHRDRVAGYLASAEADGATLVVDGRASSVPVGGFYLAPSLVDHVTPAMDVYADEIFGPVLSVVRVEDLGAAVDLVNANRYANGVAIFTASGATAHEFTRRIEVGMVGVNVAIPVPVASFSFGGWRDSLFGDRNIYGREGLEFYTRAKVVTTRWPDAAATSPAPDLSFPSTR